MASEKEDDIGEQTRGRYMDEFTNALKNLNSTKSVNKNKESNRANTGIHSNVLFQIGIELENTICNKFI